MKGYWSLPGGLVEVGETIEEALKREMFEEVGLRVELVRRFGIFERIMFRGKPVRAKSRRPEYHYVLVDYVCRVVGGELRAGDDVSRAEWVERSKLGEFKLTEGTLADIERAFRERRSRKHQFDKPPSGSGRTRRKPAGARRADPGV